MKQKFAKVPLSGITAKEVLALWQKGELYLQVQEKKESQNEIKRRCRKEALAYVAAIDDYATDVWRPVIGLLWRMIVDDEEFGMKLIMKQKHMLNRYFATSIVVNLQALGVYEPVEQVSMMKLHQTLEHITGKNSVFKNLTTYPITFELRKKLKYIMQKFDESKLRNLDLKNSTELCSVKLENG